MSINISLNLVELLEFLETDPHTPLYNTHFSGSSNKFCEDIPS